jgi:hypothetical protein
VKPLRGFFQRKRKNVANLLSLCASFGNILNCYLLNIQNIFYFVNQCNWLNIKFEIKEIFMKKAMIPLILAFFTFIGCASNKAKLFQEQPFQYDNLGKGHRMLLAAQQSPKNTFIDMSIAYIEPDDPNQPKVFVLIFFRSMAFIEIDKEIYSPAAILSGQNYSRNDFLLSGKIKVGLSPSFELESSAGVNIVSKTDSSITEMFMVNVDEEILLKIFSSESAVDIFLSAVKATISSFYLRDDEYRKTKSYVMDFFNKYR